MINRLMVMIVVVMLQSVLCLSAQSVRKVIKVQGGKRSVSEVVVDAMKVDSLKTDSLHAAKVPVDSLSAIAKDSILNDSLPKGKLKKTRLDEVSSQKFSLTRDTISHTAHFLLSLVPGVGQIYNRQYYKAPIFIGVIGGFAAGGVIASSNYNTFKNDYYHAVDLNLPSAITDPLERKMKQAGTVRTLFYSAAAVTYLYQIADATFHYRGYVNPVQKATILSAVFPGAGFVYTKRYWRLPIYYGAFAAAATVVDYNNRYFIRYRNAYNAMTDGDPTTEDEFHGRYTESQLSNARDAYRRDRDLGIICMVGIYAINIIDTYVTATLMNWDISRDLTANVKPVMFRDYAYTKSGGYASGAGLSLSIKF